MIINFSPQVMDIEVSYSVSGDTLYINSETYDFSPLGDGEYLLPSDVDNQFVVGVVERIQGEINVTLLLPINSESTEYAKFPSPTSVQDGEVEVPS